MRGAGVRQMVTFSEKAREILKELTPSRGQNRNPASKTGGLGEVWARSGRWRCRIGLDLVFDRRVEDFLALRLVAMAHEAAAEQRAAGEARAEAMQEEEAERANAPPDAAARAATLQAAMQAARRARKRPAGPALHKEKGGGKAPRPDRGGREERRRGGTGEGAG